MASQNIHLMSRQSYLHRGRRCGFRLLPDLLGSEAQGTPAIHIAVPSLHGSKYASRRTGIAELFSAKNDLYALFRGMVKGFVRNARVVLKSDSHDQIFPE